ncbi:hypothetical protein [Marinobacterium marinum]|uniref:Uncharacterized protein n=1 Tax=Marinobacterium marinum TaxID=2756129 RepID=A0A7W1WXD6_9GAMM|nr:hypothetical protein [Marinobacterium marinum]MBA4501877.1 hypothetical protein [Marinobacterium marinum]
MSFGGKHSIGVIGFAANEAAMLELFFKGNKGDGFLLSDVNHAEALIVGFSDREESAQTEKWLAQHDQPRIAVVDPSSTSRVTATDIVIHRPLTISALQAALVQLHGRLDAADQLHDEAGGRIAGDRVAASEQDKVREAVFAEWEARKERSSAALSAWKGDGLQREGEALRSRFSVERNELNSLIFEAQQALQEQQQRAPSRPASEPVEEPEDILQPPKLSAEMIQQCCGSLPDVNLDSAHERRRAYFSLDGLLLPWIQRCIQQGNESGKVQQVLGVPGALLYLPAERAFLVGVDADLLLQLTRTRFGFDEISLQERSAEAELPQGRKVAADELLWQLALFTARGRVPDTLSAEQPRVLDEMPDFERLLETPHARSIAELWQSQRLSAQNIASMLGVPQRFVFSFFVAADAIGLFCP